MSYAKTRHLTVGVKHDHLRSFTRCHPSVGVAELIWNALDADAKRVRVWLREGPMGGVDSVEVDDNGTGIDVTRVDHAFQGLGGSWKATTKVREHVHDNEDLDAFGARARVCPANHSSLRMRTDAFTFCAVPPVAFWSVNGWLLPASLRRDRTSFAARIKMACAFGGRPWRRIRRAGRAALSRSPSSIHERDGL